MSKRETSIPTLMRAGISEADAIALRRASMTLHRWHERECGSSDDYKSVCLVRGRRQLDGLEYADDGAPFEEIHMHNRSRPLYVSVPDLERSAQKRIASILARYPGLQAYVQTDPRGCALYVLRPGDIPAGADVSSCYSRGLAVY